MFLKFVVLGSVMGMLTGCLAIPLMAAMEANQKIEVTTALEPYDASRQAKLRIYYNNANIVSHPGKSCDSWNKSKLKNYLNAVTTSLPKHDIYQIGMRATQASLSVLDAEQKRGIQNVFQESVITANQPFVIDSRYVDAIVSNRSCQIAGEFIPKAGEQYEARYTHNKDYCSIQIHKIDERTEQQVYRLDPENLVRVC